MRYQIGVIGSAIDADEEIKQKARTVGRKIAELNCTLITGGCGGLPYEAVLGAKEVGGLTIGVSPAPNYREHLGGDNNMPAKEYDALVFTGFGKKGRTTPLVRSCHGVIAIAGRTGTVNELTIAYDEMRVMGILDGVGGLSVEFADMVKDSGKPGGKIIRNENHIILTEDVIKKVKNYYGKL